MTASERLAARLEGATPGPWRSWGMQLRGSTSPESADLAHSILLADFYTERQGHPRTFDLDLTITLANAAPALTDLVQAVEALRAESFDWPREHPILAAALAAVEATVGL